MNKKFCSLVDHARRTVPDELEFDVSWLMTRTGWLFVEEPFTCPNFLLNDDVVKKAQALKPGVDTKIDIKISAVGWLPVGKITELKDGRRYGEYGAEAGEGLGGSFLCFHELGEGFGFWSYFTFANGEKLIDRIRSFEKTATKEGGAYKNDRISDELHEIRWTYTAFYLMSQKLAVQVRADVDRSTKRRASRENRRVPDSIKVISLRKLETARKEVAEHKQVDWQWQWEVRGHWRNQFYPAANEHRPVFVEAYLKGPDDKPYKAPGQRLFVAVR